MTLSVQLERLNTEAAARAKRERRKANEIKTKTIQRMQLQMIAPTDIGLEHQDFELSFGQDDEYEIMQQDHRKTRRTTMNVVGEDVETSDDDEEARSEEVLDSDEEEKDKKLISLEADMDRMYETYQGKLRERDTKFKVREARKNAEKEEWRGVNKFDDSVSREDEDEEEGGWEAMQAVKFKEDNSSDESSEESGAEDAKTSISRKRVRLEIGGGPKEIKRQRLSLEASNVRRDRNGPTKIWFSQDIFENVVGLDQVSVTGDDSNDTGNYEDCAEGSDLAESVKNVRSVITFTCRMPIVVFFWA